MSLLRVTRPALKQLKQILNDHNAKSIFFGLKSGGCSGFEYLIKPTNQTVEKPDELITIDKIPIQLCGKSLMFCIGTEIDWEKSVMGEMFTFKNPMASSACGCGVSFTPKNINETT